MKVIEHGHNRKGKRTGTYSSWAEMNRRCNNPKSQNYADYGGRGIFVCERWRSFALFLEDMGPRPDGYTLDRTSNDLPYRPDNCRWATRKEQANNRRIRRDSKLDWHRVHEIHNWTAQGKSGRWIARLYGISEPEVSLIKNGKIWNLERKSQS